MAKPYRIVSSLVLALSAALCGCSPTNTNPVNAKSASSETRASGAVRWSGLPKAAHKYVNGRLDEIEQAAQMEGGVLFIGDSITDGAPLDEMFPGLPAANHGIAWDTTDGVLLRLGQITRHRPDRIFILIGTNDTDYTSDAGQISQNIFSITDALATALEDTDLYVVSILPRGGPGNAVISIVNDHLRENAVTHPYQYLDLASAMRGPDGEMDPDLSHDNLHLNEPGYALWAQTLGDCVRNGCPQGLPNTSLTLGE